MNKEMIIQLMLIQLSNETVVEEEKVKELVDFFSRLNNISEEDKQDVIKTIHSRLSVKMDPGSYIKDSKHTSWYFSAKKDIEPKYWNRYRLLLSRKIGSAVINPLDNSTDEMLDLLGNPKEKADFQRRGLVIGDVQSGKTSNYIALINKACDAGYRVIILLTGTIEKLRRQTQARLDEGFVGLDSTAFSKDNGAVYIGVGQIDTSISAWAVTSTSSDFNTSTANKLSGRLTGINEPIVFVLKKNKSVLEKLEAWLRLFNANQVDKKIHLPLLLIDDEADNASVNTRGDEDPTIINANIRKILKLFTQANYVGFTATPYANIFINPESNSEMLKDDLFPRDFIYSLEPPSNYIGARNIFNEDSKHRRMLKLNDDCEKILPTNHKREAEFDDIAESLQEAIYSFFISNAIRDLRGDAKSHRSMLINISRFISVQNNITLTVDDFVRDAQRNIRAYYKLNEEGLKNGSLNFAQKVFNKHFAHVEFKWTDIQNILGESIAPIVVRTINSGNASKSLNYDEFSENGLRLIAVGGFSLSRGLTLEGLNVSYFYRNSKMYDTLMQMGRWFGYRDGYEDLCQVWMSAEAISWYDYISNASDELRREVKRMQYEKRTPNDFGLCVRSDISTLFVTAKNKMKTAKDYEMSITLSGKMVETPYLSASKVTIQNNRQAVYNLFESLNMNNYQFADTKNLASDAKQILNVDKIYIVDFLKKYQSHSYNFAFNTESLVNFIQNPEYSYLGKWDIIIAHGSSINEVEINGARVKPVQRKFLLKEDLKAIQLSGTKSRLGSTNFAKGGLTKIRFEEIRKLIKENYSLDEEEKSYKENDFFIFGEGRNPLLVIYPVELKSTSFDEFETDDPKKRKFIDDIGLPVFGLSVGIPNSQNVPNINYKYKINLIKFKEIFELIDNDTDYFEEDENLLEAIL